MGLVISRPSIATDPADFAISPPTMRNSVVFPHPLGPKRATSSSSPKLALRKHAAPDCGDRCERRLEYHVEYLMVFWTSNAAATAHFRRPKRAHGVGSQHRRHTCFDR